MTSTEAEASAETSASPIRVRLIDNRRAIADAVAVVTELDDIDDENVAASVVSAVNEDVIGGILSDVKWRKALLIVYVEIAAAFDNCAVDRSCQ